MTTTSTCGVYAIRSVRDSILPRLSKRPGVGLLDNGSGFAKLTEIRESDSIHPQIMLSRRNYKKNYVPHIRATILTFCVFGMLLRNLLLMLQQITTATTSAVAVATASAAVSVVVDGSNLSTGSGPSKQDWILFLGVLALYLLEAVTCSTRRYLSNLYSPDEVRKCILNLIKEPPSVVWDAESFHYRSDSSRRGGHHFHHDHNDRDKEVTHRASKSLIYKSWKDTTDTRSAERQLHLNTITNSIPFVKITLTQLLLFANRDSFQEYSEQQRQFLASQRWRDSYMDHKTHVALKSFQPKILAVRGDYGDESCGGSLIPSFAKVRYFWLFTMLGLTVPYRRWFAKHCDVAEVT
eukprot:CAMPEP_0195295470 /NCGR_PEP_ID=MMETSP0707-20130614/17475_1 /TAXON_ID=33640 /ORGANISM="Asterionellopsis glacialis, Strain CCMP134" /LENGTH=350 /DNA_ID=CAMNT_0040356711 /DNA_START=124 /DNA_END=1172 /DNA_ORIENTATION=-